MGFLHSRNITTYIYGKDHRTGKVVYQEEFKGMGSINGQSFNIDQRTEYLNQLYPNLSWKYESWKD